MTDRLRLDLAGWSQQPFGDDWVAFCQVAETADRLGFDGLWLQELHFRPDRAPFPALMPLAAGLFARTERLRIGLGVVLLPLHSPLLLAEALAQLDVQSGGRLDVGVGRGSEAQVYAALGIDFTTRHERFVEAYTTLRQAWMTGVVSVAGPDGPMPAVAIRRPYQQPHPPLYLAGSSPETLAFAVRERLTLLLSLEPPTTWPPAAYCAACAAAGLPPDPTKLSLARYVCLGRTTAEAHARCEALLLRLHQRRLAFARRRGEPARSPEPPTRARFMAEQALVGDPADCLEQLRALVGATGIRHLRLVFNGNGVLSTAEALAQMTLFGQEVLPHCRFAIPAEVGR
jgi:alkanesulfonate monooxygenase SsuD/methylene tetrahydromethanopterin reductase-like flavin-dependent oxidoreductase (luciferase family)